VLIVVIAIDTLGLSPIDLEVRGWTILNAEASLHRRAKLRRRYGRDFLHRARYARQCYHAVE